MVTGKKATSSKSKKTAGAPIAGAVGRRKKCVARAWLRSGVGAIRVNGQDVKTYFDTEATRQEAIKSFLACPTSGGFDVQIKVFGGGKSGQADAVKLAIARVLVENDETLRPAMRKGGLLTVDARIKERKKYGQRGARRKFQFVKR